MSSAISFLFHVPSWVKKRACHPLDDAVDRLSSSYSIPVLFVCFTLSVTNMLFGDSMSCWTNKEFPGHWANFYSYYCYIQPQTLVLEAGTYRRYIAYFPWVPYIIVVQAILFVSPRTFWHFFASRAELDLHAVLERATEIKDLLGEQRQKVLDELTSYMMVYNEFTHKGSNKLFFVLQSPTAMAYLIHKWAYFGMALTQFKLLVHILGNGDNLWGFHAMKQLLEGNTTTSNVFPLITYCQVPEMFDGQYRNRMINCLMTFNILYEKIFIVIYFWIMFLTVVTFLSAFISTLRLFVPIWRVRAIHSRLRPGDVEPVKQRLVNRFLYYALHADGLLALQLIESSCGRETAEDVTRTLFANFTFSFRDRLRRGVSGATSNGSRVNNYGTMNGTAPPAEHDLLTSVPLMDRAFNSTEA
uniref:Innexin n=1 Tax=Panagrellus redivivus TaxID=6233 RepID=A0A7E4ZVC8_PANRE